jgi:hypothetical protein
VFTAAEREEDFGGMWVKIEVGSGSLGLRKNMRAEMQQVRTEHTR